MVGTHTEGFDVVVVVFILDMLLPVHHIFFMKNGCFIPPPPPPPYPTPSGHSGHGAAASAMGGSGEHAPNSASTAQLREQHAKEREELEGEISHLTATVRKYEGDLDEVRAKWRAVEAKATAAERDLADSDRQLTQVETEVGVLKQAKQEALVSLRYCRKEEKSGGH
jgi:hypothetical protein